MQKPWIEIIDNQGLVERVANERQNHDLFGELPNGKSKPQRLELVERPTLGLSEILYGPPKGLRHVVLSLGRRIVAVAGVQNDHYDQTHLAITHLSVEEEHRGKGFARMLIEAIYDYAIERGQKVVSSTFSPSGKRLEHIHIELNRRFPQAAPTLEAT